MLSVNAEAMKIVRKILDSPEALGVEASRFPNGSTLIDMGQRAAGSWEAARYFTLITLGGLDEAAVAQAIQAGHLYGAAADTFVYEPIRGDNPLLALAVDPAANMVLTPHTGSGTITDWDRLRAEDYANAISLLAGQPLRYRVA